MCLFIIWTLSLSHVFFSVFVFVAYKYKTGATLLCIASSDEIFIKIFRARECGQGLLLVIIFFFFL